MKKSFISGAAVLALLLSSTSFATSFSESASFFVRYHFTKFAYGKQVSAVYAHSGVLRTNSGCMGPKNTYWEKPQHIKMEYHASTNQFFGKALMYSSGGECQATINGPIVEYWVYFTDGSHLITPAAMVPLHLRRAHSSEEYEFLRREQGNDFSRWEESSSTVADGLQWGYAS